MFWFYEWNVAFYDSVFFLFLFFLEQVDVKKNQKKWWLVYIDEQNLSNDFRNHPVSKKCSFGKTTVGIKLIPLAFLG